MPAEADDKGSWDLPIVFLLVLATVLRIAWLSTKAIVIENEGGEYASIADNLLAGRGYLGQGLTGKPEMLFPPLYPFSIAAVSLLARDTELAARIVSLVMGVLLVWIIGRLATDLFGRSAGLCAALLAAVHPILISLSTSVYSEGTYFGLMFSGLLLAIRALESRALKHFVAASALFGLAYLTRPEAVVYPAILSVVALAMGLADRSSPRPSLRQTAVGITGVVVAFAVVASPYVAFLHAHTGRLLLEGKSPSNFALGQQMRAGKDVLDAYYGVSDDLRETGAYMGDINRHVSDPSLRPRVSEAIRAAAALIPRETKLLVGAARSPRFGGLLLFLLAMVGFAAGWTRRRAGAQIMLVLALLGIFASLLSVQFYWSRFSFVLLPFLLLWAGHGIALVSRKAEERLRRIRPNAGSLTAVGFGITVTLLGGIALLAAKSASRAYDDYGSTKEGALLTKEAGIWLKDQLPRNKVVMDAGSAIPYYAKAEYIALPYSSSETALRYIDAKHPDFVILRGLLREQRPYLAAWLASGIPGNHWRLVHSVGSSEKERIAIYRGARADDSTPPP